MKRTKIVCTMGPNADDKKILKRLFEAGMNIARFNFSHGDYDEHLSRMNLFKETREETDVQVATMLDTKGPEIRTGILKDGKKVRLETGKKFVLTTQEQEGNDKIVYITYDGLAKDVKSGDRILIDDGLIELEVEKVSGKKIECIILNGGELGEKKGVNVPNVKIKLPALTDKDRADIEFGIGLGFDFIAASFVRNASCIEEIRKILVKAGADIKIIAKVENAEGIENIDEIIEAADGVMVARGDMGVEIPAQMVPFIQKTIIRKCNEACKPVITATQMLDSMIRNPRPTRAEVTDVANAIYDGTDCVMLSGETAMGKYPVEALKMMVKIAEETEKHLDHSAYRQRKVSGMNKRNVSNSVCYSAVATADDIKAKAIIAPSISGFTVRLLSKWRPDIPIYGLTPSAAALRRMQIYWGVTPIEARRADTTDGLISSSVELLKKKKFVKKEDLVVITAGIISKKERHEPARHTNIMQVEKVD